jgi:hypothetical protein
MQFKPGAALNLRFCWGFAGFLHAELVAGSNRQPVRTHVASNHHDSRFVIL